MYEVYNMGHRFEIYLNESKAQQIIDIAAAFNIEAKIIGHVEESERSRLTIVTEHGEFVY
jgi:phosphoribosylformylglycinamidine cyclo-ligase